MIYRIFFYVKIYLEITKHQNEKETERGYEMMKDCKRVLKTFRHNNLHSE